MYDQVVKCQRAGLCLSEHFLILQIKIDSIIIIKKCSTIISKYFSFLSKSTFLLSAVLCVYVVFYMGLGCLK